MIIITVVKATAPNEILFSLYLLRLYFILTLLLIFNHVNLLFTISFKVKVKNTVVNVLRIKDLIEQGTCLKSPLGILERCIKVYGSSPDYCTSDLASANTWPRRQQMMAQGLRSQSLKSETSMKFLTPGFNLG